jgi:hypothetical protein
MTRKHQLGADCLDQNQVSHFRQLGDPLVPQGHNLANRHLSPLSCVTLPKRHVGLVCELQNHVCAVAGDGRRNLRPRLGDVVLSHAGDCTQ